MGDVVYIPFFLFPLDKLHAARSELSYVSLDQALRGRHGVVIRLTNELGSRQGNLKRALHSDRSALRCLCQTGDLVTSFGIASKDRFAAPLQITIL